VSATAVIGDCMRILTRRIIGDKIPLWMLLLVFAAAFGVRIWALQSVTELPTYKAPVLDEEYHLKLVSEINSPEGLPKEPYFSAPLYPYWLAIIDRLTGNTRFWSRLLQIVLGSFLPILMIWLGNRLVSWRAGLVVGWVTVFYPLLVYFETSLLIESLMAFLIALLLWRLLKCEDKPSLVNFAIAGAVLGLTGIARPNILLLLPFLAIWFLTMRTRSSSLRSSLARAAVLLAACGVVILPVTLRNLTVSGEPVLIAWQGGINFYLGNHRDSDGWEAAAPGIDGSWQSVTTRPVQEAEYAEGRRLSFSDVSDYWYRQAENEIREDFGGWISRLLRKCRLLVNGYEIPNDLDIYTVGERVPVVRLFLTRGPIYFPFGLLAPLALLGLLMSIPQWRRLSLLYLTTIAYSLSIIAFFVNARYREPLLPLFMLFAALGCARTWSYLRNKRWLSAGIWLLVLVGLVIESNHYMLSEFPRQIEAQGLTQLGASFVAQGKPDSALAYFGRALEADPSCIGALNHVGTDEARAGHPIEASRRFCAVLELDPYNMLAYLNLTGTLLAMRKFDSALVIADKAVQVAPFDGAAFYRLAQVYFALGDSTQARDALDHSLSLDPNSEKARALRSRTEGM